MFLGSFRAKPLQAWKGFEKISDMTDPSSPTLWPEYFSSITNGDSRNEIARKTGYSASTISRWTRGLNRPQPRHVEHLAEVYGVSLFETLTAAGYFEPGETDGYEKPRLFQLRDFTLTELAAEILRRSAHLVDPSDPEFADDLKRYYLAFKNIGKT